jgi:hypothetical protein
VTLRIADMYGELARWAEPVESIVQPEAAALLR